MSKYCRVCIRLMPKKRKGHEQVCPNCKITASIDYYKVSNSNVRVRVRIPGRKQIIDISYNQWEQLHKAVTDVDIYKGE